jgi:hypothetical protein
MGYLHPDKQVSLERVLVKKKARKRPKATVTSAGNLIQNLAAQLAAKRKGSTY